MAASRPMWRSSSCGAGRRLETRPAKEHHSLAEMTGGLAPAGRELHRRRPGLLGRRTGGPQRPAASARRRPGRRHPGRRRRRGGRRRVAERRATFCRANVLAEVHRQLHGVRFASPDERIAVAERTADLALAQSLLISAPELHHTPERLRRADGTSRFRAKGHEVYTTATLLEAEARLLEAGRQMGGPVVTMGTVAAVTEANLPGRDHRLSASTRPLAVEQIATSGRRLDVLGRPGRDGQVHHDGRAAGRVGSRARRGLGARPGPLGRRGRGAGERARHRHREHGQVALRAPPRSRAAAQDQRTAQRTRIPSQRLAAPARRCASASPPPKTRWPAGASERTSW